MKAPLFYLTLIFICLNISCKSQQYTLEDLPKKQLVFGKGGGITGAVDTYVLLENGQLFHSNSMTEEGIELEKIPKKEAKECYSQMQSLELSKMDFDHPGNMYYFLEEVDSISTNRIVWGSNNHEVPEACKHFYRELQNFVK